MENNQLYAGFPEFKKTVQLLVGLKCWSVVAGVGTGSMLSISFGRKIGRKVPLKNPAVATDVRFYAGEYVLFIKNCSWRFQEKNMPLCSSNSDNVRTMLKEIKKMRAHAVEEIKSTSACDINLKFNDGLLLQLFCDSIDEEAGDNYSFLTPEYVYTVVTPNIITKEIREIN